MNYFIFFTIGLLIGCFICGIILFMFFIKKITVYENSQIKNINELERYRNEFRDKYIDDGYDAY